MPTPQQFLEAVMAWPGPQGPGYVNLHWKKPQKDGKDQPGMPGRPFKELHEFMNFAQQAAAKGTIYNDIYYCLSTQKQTGKTYGTRVTAARGAHLADKLKAIWLDVDGNKPSEKGYASKQEAITEFIKFTKAAGLPLPTAIIDSGNGYHIYWIAQQPMTVGEWTPFATGLWALVKEHGFRCDNVTTDCARVLRVPGTFNRKDPANAKPVRLMGKPEDPIPAGYDFPVALAHVAAKGQQAAIVTAPVTVGAKPLPFDISMFAGQKMNPALAHLNPQADNLSDGIGTMDDRPLDFFAGDITKCGHFMDCMINKGAGQGQGLWSLTLLACTFFEDGVGLAHNFSKGYPSYSQGETQAKFEEKVSYKAQRDLGWPSCQSFANEGCKSCATCPLKGMLKSPLQLAQKVAPPMGVAAPGPLAPIAPEEMELPSGFTVDPVSKHVVAVVEKQAPDGTLLPPQYQRMFQHPIDAPWVAHDGLHFRMSTGLETRQVTINDEAIASDQLLCISLSKQQCHVEVDGQKWLRKFMTSWVAQIERSKQRLISFPMGWVEQDGETRGFAYGGHVYLDSGVVDYAGFPDKDLVADYTPVGSDKYLRQIFKVITDQHHPALEVLALGGFASPLMKITGEDGMVLWGFSTAGGAFKSTSLLASAAVWGNPRRIKDNSTASIVGIQSKLANVRNLPAYIDEIQRLDQVDAVLPQINIITEGVSGSKSKRDGTSRAKKEWQLLVTCGSNASMRKRLREKVKGTDASLLRVFEIEVEKRGRTAIMGDIRHLTERLNSNFGQLGVLYAQHLGVNHRTVFERGKEIERDMYSVLTIEGEHRFWVATVVAILLAAEQANLILGEEMFHPAEIKDYLYEAFRDQQRFVQHNFVDVSSKDGAEDFMSEFLKANTDNQIWTWDMNKGAGRQPLSIVKAPPEGHNNPINIHWFVTDKVVRISTTAIENWVKRAHENVDPSTVIDTIYKQFNAQTLRRCNLSAGCAGSKGQAPERCLEISIAAGSVLEDTLLGPVGNQTPPAGLTGTAVVTGIPITAAVTGPTGPTP